jgi:hypothetical protein
MTQALRQLRSAIGQACASTSLIQLATNVTHALVRDHEVGLGGAAFLWVEEKQLTLLSSTFPQPGRSFASDADHRYARMARGELPATSGAEWLVALNDMHGAARGYLVLMPRASVAADHSFQLELVHWLALAVAPLAIALALGDGSVAGRVSEPLRGEAFARLLASEFERAQRYERSLTLGLVTCTIQSQQLFPSVLERLARNLHQWLRATDVIGQYREDTVAILLPETPLELAARKAEHLRTRLVLVDSDLNGVIFGLSARGWSTSRVVELIEQAEGALREAHLHGACVMSWDDDQPRIVPRRLATPLT